MKIIIVSPSYKENKGGIIALHKLCHCINELGGTAFLYPYITEHSLSYDGVVGKLDELKKRYIRKFKINEKLNTPVIRKLTQQDREQAVVVYPETVSGNPAKIKNVVRWFLHHPGFHTGNVAYSKGELYFSYGSFGLGLSVYGSKLSDVTLEVTHFFTEYYNRDGVADSRSGTAYCMRKGKGRRIVHDLSDSVLIDGMSHAEVASVFKKVKYFISYDLYTAYTWFAIMCGCIPIVIPEDGILKKDWYHDEKSSIGIAYGFEEVSLAESQQNDAIRLLDNKECKSYENVKLFLGEIDRYFSGNNRHI